MFEIEQPGLLELFVVVIIVGAHSEVLIELKSAVTLGATQIVCEAELIPHKFEPV